MRLACLLPLTVLALSLAAAPAEAKTYASFGGTVDRPKQHTKKFTVTGEGKQKLKVTLSCTAIGTGGQRMRVYFYTTSPQGGRRQLTHLRININGSTKEKTATFSLPPGNYSVAVSVRRMKFNFRLTDG